ncbi:cation:proton antiporter [Gordonia hankookensis]|uniref:Sodium:proton antiporter n=1 Tax=Gordonia hankookensis TaxID=589403 RepID=A0ABR7WEN7_9ACTN|nr:sodium:proton antiporter [Gordonia hankookensis]MBD1321246.1 sodium:proton antiporter [Gordonia hankookensis]
MHQILLVVVAVLGIAAAQVIGPRIRVAPPLLLVVVGVVVGVMPFVPAVDVDPEWILIGVLPPLLYSAAVSMPTMDFRRDFGAISALSVLLVLVSAVLLGFFFVWVIPGIGLATAIALGAIVSPTDAVATSIAKRLGVPHRVTAVLEGESMLNDATSLVLLRSAIAAIAASFSFGHVAVDFVLAVVVAVIIGTVVGWLNLAVRARVPDATVNTAISFTVPYLAYIPAEELGASGLVAAVTAGLITGAGAARFLTPQHRLSDSQNWRTVELIVEGGVFLLMGLELWGLVVDVHDDHDGVDTAVWIGLAALALAVVIRAAYVVPLVLWLDRAAQRGTEMRPMLADINATMVERQQEGPDRPIRRTREARSAIRREWRRLRRRMEPRRWSDSEELPPTSPETARLVSSRLTRQIADIDYYRSAPLGPKEATIVVWGGLRGVVTLAAAQTLPGDVESRSLLVLIAFVVAAASLLCQGGTLAWLIRVLKVTEDTDGRVAEHHRLRAELTATSRKVIAESELVARYPVLRKRFATIAKTADTEEGIIDANMRVRAAYEQIRRDLVAAQREVLLQMRDEGTFHSALLEQELRQLDAEEISLDLRAED